MLIDVKGIISEDFVNYKKPSMTIMMPKCSFKCDKDCGMQVCQNSALATAPTIQVELFNLLDQYIHNDITSALVFQGLEPFDSYDDMHIIIGFFRMFSNDDIVIYTGYKKEELYSELKQLENIPNIIVKFGRYLPHCASSFDEVLGVELASFNQYAEKIS